MNKNDKQPTFAAQIMRISYTYAPKYAHLMPGLCYTNLNAFVSLCAQKLAKGVGITVKCEAGDGTSYDFTISPLLTEEGYMVADFTSNAAYRIGLMPHTAQYLQEKGSKNPCAAQVLADIINGEIEYAYWKQEGKRFFEDEPIRECPIDKAEREAPKYENHMDAVREDRDL